MIRGGLRNDMDRGYVALWRKIVDHPFSKEKRVFSKYEAWLDILMEVQHSEKEVDVVIGMSVFKCGYAESLKSVLTWSRRWGWSESKVRRFFKLLEKMNQISLKSEGKTTRITVLNYSQYDPKRRTNEALPKRYRSVTEALPSTDKNDKNENNYISSKEDKSKPSVSTPFCPHEEIRKLYNQTLPELPTCTVRNSTFDKYTRSRWSEDPQRQSIAWWKDFFNTIHESDFLMGRTDKPFTCSLDWIVKPTNFTKILNGNYKNRGTQKKELSWKI